MTNTEIFLFTIDSLRKDHFTKSYFPTCWSIFESEFITFENALSNGVATPFSFPSIVTGRTVTEDGSLPSEFPTISEEYDGYSWAITNNPHLRPERGYSRGFNSFSDDLSDIGSTTTSDGLLRTIKRIGSQSSLLRSGYKRFTNQTGMELIPKTGIANDLTTQVRKAMSENRGLFWAHFMDPHYPFRPDRITDKDLNVDHAREAIDQMNVRFKQGDANESDLAFLRSMYGETVRYLDRSLYSLFSYMKDQNRWDNSIIVIMSDHGEAFGEHGVYNHMWDADPIDSLVQVPLLVKFSGNMSGSYSHLVQNADLLPTLASELDWEIQNLSHAKCLRDTDDRTVVSKSNSAVRVTTKTGYGIRRKDGTKRVQGNLNSTAKGLLESTTIPKVNQITDDLESEKPSELPDLEERLESLGYK
ncbi:sulfatase-like hydrolase/transferase [Natrialba asiatica]|uniref:Arylsulfatase A family protein n=1 Tax=Natrialba asiatica (strain ATCC 700177 / DSM 12278 / JCM 9576 / FERM P-10747 / NBRC 102637 / 172P1) TaxID=29540 RepID=M0AU02_NATA1|nr:sulfatase-like hydrolase/transferase [Natrialba asiatica]ELZ01817.1 arylsulfatase A family protein [Natrialba asiatica DSM 12278]